jgi:hypothetical protein
MHDGLTRLISFGTTRGAAALAVMQAPAAARRLPSVASVKVTFSSWPMDAVMPDSLKAPVGVNW